METKRERMCTDNSISFSSIILSDLLEENRLYDLLRKCQYHPCACALQLGYHCNVCAMCDQDFGLFSKERKNLLLLNCFQVFFFFFVSHSTFDTGIFRLNMSFLSFYRLCLYLYVVDAIIILLSSSCLLLSSSSSSFEHVYEMALKLYVCVSSILAISWLPDFSSTKNALLPCLL